MKKIVNNEVVEMTAEEVSTREAEIAKEIEISNEEKAIEDKRKVDAKAGNDKLIELGLTQDQVTAMTGYVPPTEE
tara:strand:- start:210 stop:434 length:225 start_codon:yes stop_codon:yes gene_type:complete